MDSAPAPLEHHVSSADAIAWLKALPAGLADLVVLDPGVPGRAARRPAARPAIGTKARPLKAAPPATPAFPAERLPLLLFEVRRVLASTGLAWWVTESAPMFHLSRLADRLGFAVGAPLVWDRGDGPGARLAFVLPLSRLRPRSPGPELVQVPQPLDPPWPGSLPQALCDALVEAATEPGHRVIDPFMGSGAVGVAALTRGCRYFGCDVLPEAMELAGPRLLATQSPRLDALPHADHSALDVPQSAVTPPTAPPHGAWSLSPHQGLEVEQLSIFGSETRTQH